MRESKSVSTEEKRMFFKNCNINFGSSALCLSGGASFGYCKFFRLVIIWFCQLPKFVDHFGIVRALLDQNLLPRVVAGTSAGGLVAALVCTRTDDELKAILIPELAKKLTACNEPLQTWVRRFRRTGARFDTIDWARKVLVFYKSG